MKATEQFYPVVLFFKYYAVQVGSKFLERGLNPKVYPFK